jgi:hypothetical protein
MESKLDDCNVLRFYSGCLPFSCAALVAEKCLEMILSDPIKYIQTDDFLELSQDAIISIFKQPTIDCLPSDLKKGMLKWLSINKKYDAIAFTDETYEFVEKKLNLVKADIDFKHLYKANKINTLRLNYTEKGRITEKFKFNFIFNNIHGLGIIIGYADNNIKYVPVTVKIYKSETLLKELKEVIENPKNQMLIHDIMFEKIMIKPDGQNENELEIKVNFPSYDNCKNTRVVHTHLKKNKKGIEEKKEQTIAYLICS